MNDELQALIDQAIDGTLTEADGARLAERLRDSASDRELYWECVQQHFLLDDLLRESRGRDLALVEEEASDEISPLGSVAGGWSRWAALATAACVLLGLGYGLLSFTPKAETVAEILSIDGVVQVRNAGGRLTLAASGAAIGRGEAIVVGEGESSAQVVLTNGSRFQLETDSVLRFGACGESSCKLHLEHGGLHVDAPPRAITLTTEHANITSQGGRFRLYSDAAMSRIEPGEGVVQFQRQTDGRSVEVAEGFFAVAVANSALTPQPLSQAACRLERTLLRAGHVGCLSHDGLQLAAARKRAIRVWDLQSGAEIGSVTNLEQAHFQQLAFANDNRSLAALSSAGVALWRRGETAADFFPLRPKFVRHSALASDATRIVQAIGSEAGEVAVWKLNFETNSVSLLRSIKHKPWSAAVTPAGEQATIVAGRWDGEMNLFSADNGEARESYRAASSPMPIALSDNGRYLAAFTNKEGLSLVDRQAGEAAQVSRRILWPMSGARAACLKFSADGRLLFAGMNDGLVRVWSTESGESVLVLETGDPKVGWLDLAPDGKRLVTGGRDDSIKVWDCEWPEGVAL